MKRQDKTLETYNKFAQVWSECHNTNNFWLNEFKEFKKHLKGKKILEIGCGGGRDVSFFLTERLDYLGIDGSRGMIAVCRQKYPGVKFKLINMYDLKLPAASFNGCWSAATLLHAPKTRIKKIMRSIKTLLTNDGIVFIGLKKQARDLKDGWLQEDENKERYFSYYTKDSFTKILKSTGFRTVHFHEKIAKYATWLCFFVKKING